MSTKLIILLISFSIYQVHCQYQQCDCTTLDNCVTSETAKMTTCRQSCSSSFTTGGATAFQCVVNKENVFTQNMNTVKTCIETAAGGRPCRTSRVRRDDDWTMMSPGSGHGMGGGGFGGRGTRLTGAARTDMDAYRDCFYQCMRPNQDSMGARGFGGGHGGGFGKFYGACPQINNCYLAPPNPQTSSTSFQTCFDSTRSTMDAAEQTFCTCLQGAYSAGTVTCSSTTQG